MDNMRVERDTMGEMWLPQEALYGATTQRAVENFPISGQPLPGEFLVFPQPSASQPLTSNLILDLRGPAFRTIEAVAAAKDRITCNDADLIGNPIRVSVSPRTLERGEAEVKLRTASEAFFVPLTDLLPTVRQHLDEMYAALSGDPPAA